MPGEQLCPLSLPDTDPTDWGAFKSKEGFELAELVYCKARMSTGSIDKLFEICSGKQVPFSNHTELYVAIDSLTVRGGPMAKFLGSIHWHTKQQQQCTLTKVDVRHP